MLGSLARDLRTEAHRANERRVLCLAGDGDPEPSLREVLDAASLDTADTVLLGHRDLAAVTRHEPRRAGALLGTTHDCVVVDLRDECRPNALGRAVGAVDGGGLLVVLTPPLDDWPRRRDRFDETLAVPPDTLDDVAGNVRRRLVTLLRDHRGVAVVDLDAGTVEHDGLTDPAPVRRSPPPDPPAEHAFPRVAYDSCLTADQVETVRAFESLRDPNTAVVCTADRGRGKSSAAGLAAGALAAAGRDVLVTAGDRRGAGELFARAREVLDALGTLADDGTDTVRASDGGRVRFADPAVATDLPEDPDVVFVDEAAGLPVDLLAAFLGRVPVGYATTLHGYEGAGRGFAVRFRDRLAAAADDVTEVTMADPIRYAATDPVEPWAFRALLLDASPPVEPLVVDATPESVEYVAPSPTDLLADEHLLREAFGLLVLAHYRTEPDDLARLLDAPNLSTRLLTHDGHAVAVALVAREGGLDTEACEAVYREGRIQGNMLPDLMTGQLRDPDAAGPVGRRVVRIAVHPQVQSRGLGSRLLDELHTEYADADWFGTSFGATPRLLDFWYENGYRPVHLSATRNATSGEHSAALLRGDSPLVDRHTGWFRERVGDVLADTLRDLPVDVVRRALAASEFTPPDLTDREWRLVAAAAYGPGQFDMHPGPFRRLALAALTDSTLALSADGERLLVRRVLQLHDWEAVADELGYYSASGARRELGRTLQSLAESYGTKAAHDERDRYG
ncbi:tRNA(Met) cytidine acetyltransferase TmcA [Halomarina oriensis]|uniref:tRNA(Met) cytidine acetyltransferase TmcA n=1 Tax=Halomarina oriensis TaxID=671145 RepID=A0A6B0GJU8_9EURY|nr:tRNA(Met) cytidine acetyltransferase TmcA [Halomarina oriensis]MWG33083.1 GNAT family N-acetyltransferase [Halomarina oriensis]